MWIALKLYASKVWEFLLPIIKIFMSQIGPALADIALQAVSTYSMADMTNDEKRQAAFSVIAEQLKKKGIEVGTSVINTAIELAYQKIKATLPPCGFDPGRGEKSPAEDKGRGDYRPFFYLSPSSVISLGMKSSSFR